MRTASTPTAPIHVPVPAAVTNLALTGSLVKRSHLVRTVEGKSKRVSN